MSFDRSVWGCHREIGLGGGVFRQSCRLEHQPIVEGLNGLDDREIVGLRQIAGDLFGITAKPRQNCKIKVLKLFAELV